MLTIWLRDHGTARWANVLPFVQAAKNRRFHSGINRTPYEAMFGRKMVLGNENDPSFNIDQEKGSSDGEHDEVKIK